MKKIYDFGFGDTRGLREMTLRRFFDFGFESTQVDWNLHGGYASHQGNPELVTQTRKLISDLTGKNYKHVLITAGATNALNAYLYAKRDDNTQYAFTNEMYYGMYPQIITNQGYYHSIIGKEGNPHSEDVTILDSPTNPKGEIIPNLMAQDNGRNIVWDAAYYSPTYYGTWNGTRLSIPKVFPAHEAMVGSFSKLTSINGIRIGWLATDDSYIVGRAYDYIHGDACSVNGVGQELVARFLKTVDMDEFYKAGNSLISDNKQEISRLCYLLGHEAIPEHGMFAFAPTDTKMKDLFSSAGVVFSNGHDMGASFDSVRINLANTREETREMVQAILKADGK